MENENRYRFEWKIINLHFDRLGCKRHMFVEKNLSGICNTELESRKMFMIEL